MPDWRFVMLLGIGVAADFGDREGVVVSLSDTIEVSRGVLLREQLRKQNAKLVLLQIITKLREQNAKLVLENAKLAAFHAEAMPNLTGSVISAVPTVVSTLIDGPPQALSLEALQAQWRAWHTDLCSSDTKPDPADAPQVLIEEHHDQYAVTPDHTTQCYRSEDSEDNNGVQRAVMTYYS